MSGISADQLRQVIEGLMDIDAELPSLGELASAKRHIDDAIDEIELFIDYLEGP